MADSTIGGLPRLADVTDDSLLAVEFQGEAWHLTGAQWKKYAIEAGKGFASEAAEAAKEAARQADRAEDASEAAQQAQEKAAQSAETAIQYSGKPPIPQNGTWWIWNAGAGRYEDTGVKSILSIVKSYGSVEEMNADLLQMQEGDLVIIAADINVEENSRLYVHTGTSWQYLSDLSGIQGVGISNIVLTEGDHSPGTTDLYTIYLTDGRTIPVPVYNGANGGGVPAGGGTGQVLVKLSDANQDVGWADQTGGGGGGGAAAVLEDFAIPVAGWLPVEDGPESFLDYRYVIDVPVAEAMDDQSSSFAIASLYVAAAAELSPTHRVTDGAVRFWANNIPTEPIKGTLTLFSDSGGSGTGGGTDGGGGGVAAGILEDFTVPAEGWTAVAQEDEAYGAYLYTISVPADEAREAYSGSMAWSVASLSVAGAADLCPSIRVVDGAVRFWSNAIPTDAMTGTLTLFAEGGGGGTGGIPAGGDSGQVLAKASGKDYDIHWASQIGGALNAVDDGAGTVILTMTGVSVSYDSGTLTLS